MTFPVSPNPWPSRRRKRWPRHFSVLVGKGLLLQVTARGMSTRANAAPPTKATAPPVRSRVPVIVLAVKPSKL
jgi:hypothetical protein